MGKQHHGRVLKEKAEENFLLVLGTGQEGVISESIRNSVSLTLHVHAMASPWPVFGSIHVGSGHKGTDAPKDAVRMEQDVERDANLASNFSIACW